MLYLVPLLAFPFLVLFRPRLAFAMLGVTIVLMYMGRTRTGRSIARRRPDDEDSSYWTPRMKEWKDPWRTGKR